MKSCLGERSTIGTCLFEKKLRSCAPLGLFNLPLTEALRGVLVFQRRACVDQVSGKSVSCLDRS